MILCVRCLFADSVMNPVWNIVESKYTPGSTITININFNYTFAIRNDFSVGLSLNVPDAWGENSLEWISGTSPQLPLSLDTENNNVACGWLHVDGHALPASSEQLTFKISVPADASGQAELELSAYGLDIENTSSIAIDPLPEPSIFLGLNFLFLIYWRKNIK